LVVGLMTAGGPAVADGEEDAAEAEPGVVVRRSPSVEISGFGDLVASYHGGGVGGSFRVGQAEIDLTVDLGRRVGAEMAIAYEGEIFSLGAFVVGVTLYERTDGKPGILGLEVASVSGGQFDVPFGIDWKVYPSFDRRLISVPLVVEQTHGGWNDYGFTGRLNARWGNVALFAVSDLEFAGTVAGGEEIASDADYALGGRVGLRPLGSVELGGSYALSEGNPGAFDQELVGADFQLDAAPFAFKGEYISHTITPFGGPHFRTHGFYFQAIYSTRGYFLVARHDALGATAMQGSSPRRTSAGGGWIITENCELRIEYQRSASHIRDCALTQVAFAF
jgi:hypothetical protein